MDPIVKAYVTTVGMSSLLTFMNLADDKDLTKSQQFVKVYIASMFLRCFVYLAGTKYAEKERESGVYFDLD